MSGRYYSLNDYFKETYGEKIYKVSLDAGLNCPNRDGTISSGGCIFCSDSGSGEFAGTRTKTIHDQIEEQLQLINKKFPEGKVIAYFQNFTNTYGDIQYLRKIYYEALSHPRVIGLAIATRPDCINDDVLSLLKEINSKYFLWLEFGLQTSDNEVAKIINRGYDFSVYEQCAKVMVENRIKFVTHIILGLPKSQEKDSLITAKKAAEIGSWGIKLHTLYIIKGSNLEKLYQEKYFKHLEFQEYIDSVVEILEELPSKAVIHRLTGDGEKETLVEPKWSLNKLNVLNSVEKALKNRNSFQGINYKKVIK